jgi:DNA-binding response OmpR family regulator
MSTPSVLIVDDDPALRTLLGRVAAMEGFTPITAGSGAEGHAELQAHAGAIHLVLLDMTLPDIDGFAFRTRQLAAAAHAAIPTVILSGKILTPQEAATLDAAAILVKPVGVAALRQAIVRHARERETASAAQ